MKKINDQIVVSIMVGGLSRRMGGGIKSLLKFNNKKIFDRILKNIQRQTKKVIINCNHQNEKFKTYNLPIIADIKEGYLGPLAGIHAGLNWLKKNNNGTWLITIPGDTPFIPNDLIINFTKKISSNVKILLAKSNKKIHPSIGAWHISLLDSLEKNIECGTRKILDWSEKHPTEFIDFTQNNYDPFFNINTKEDISKAKDIENAFLKKIPKKIEKSKV